MLGAQWRVVLKLPGFPMAFDIVRLSAAQLVGVVSFR